MASRSQRRLLEVLSANGGALPMTRRRPSAAAQAGQVTQYVSPGPNVGNIVGPDQNIWFIAGGEVVVFDPSSQTFQTFNATGGLIQELAVGSDGNIWFVVSWAQPGQVGRCTPQGGVSTWPIDGWSNGLVLGNDGNIWFNEMSANGLPGKRIGSVTPGGVVSQYGTTFDTQDPIVGPGGNIWFGETGALIGMVTSNGEVTEYPALQGTTSLLVTPDGNVWFGSQTDIGFVTPSGQLTTINTGGNGTFGLVLGANGDTVWFGSSFSSQVGQASLDGQLIGMYDTSGLPMGLCIGGDGNLWFTQLADAIGSVSPGGAINEYTTFGVGPYAPILGADGNVWFPDGGNNSMGNCYIGRVTPEGAVNEFLTNAIPSSLLNSPNGGALIYFNENTTRFGSVVVLG